ncbi:hypothetical protein PHYSODRAFT_323744 [Phytophthora sojae]|uniref:Ubiquitin-like protease family profile domain-containing protein n=1 Tax=Phytophthora sojae (strain P6497) TaxID=1094619 RepID=G4YLH2_PHYSP|nr:hypothetical protein PHYSODRAFT_323744 [Phytophthora sojae]EGZ30346.1 hypothetical protein PHYSODRAFT_323744 [Phytophthora sojae]|eukprot:XP_009517621.1 hypothetical protein PHYSODRAFT_323744 [Phytophthora sojae]
MTVNPELFDVETDSDELTDDTTWAQHAALANEVLQQLEGASLSSTFRLASGAGTFYEPLCDPQYRATIEDTYEETVAPFLLGGHKKTMIGVEYPVVENGVWLDAPRQPDGTSCGVMVIAQVYCMLKDNFRFTKATVSADDVAVMRLRIMWMILMQPA